MGRSGKNFPLPKTRETLGGFTKASFILNCGLVNQGFGRTFRYFGGLRIL
jgi:hypothetical protein